MKKLIILMTVLLIGLFAQAQYVYYEEDQTDLDNSVTIFIRGGYQFKSAEAPQDIITAFGFPFRAHGIALTPEVIIHYDQSQPVDCGVKASYKWNNIEAGYGRYFSVYSLDKGKTDYNTWCNMFFVSYHATLLRQNWFFETDYYNENLRVTLGVNGLIAKLQ